jgi:hypothetical protein
MGGGEESRRRASFHEKEKGHGLSKALIYDDSERTVLARLVAWLAGALRSNG